MYVLENKIHLCAGAFMTQNIEKMKLDITNEEQSSWQLTSSVVEKLKAYVIDKRWNSQISIFIYL